MACRRSSALRASYPYFLASASTARSASIRMPMPSLASASVRVIGGAIRSAWPYSPPLPISSPRPRVDQVDGEHEALAPHAPDRRQRRGRVGQPADDHAAEGGGIALQVVIEH